MSAVGIEMDDSESDSRSLPRAQTLSHDTRRRVPKRVSFGTEQSVAIVEYKEEEEDNEISK